MYFGLGPYLRSGYSQNNQNISKKVPQNFKRIYIKCCLYSLYEHLSRMAKIAKIGKNNYVTSNVCNDPK